MRADPTQQQSIQLEAARDSGVLTRREREIVRWACRGLTNKEIARQLAISDATVKTHLQHIFSKLNITRRMQLAFASTDLELPISRDLAVGTGRLATSS